MFIMILSTINQWKSIVSKKMAWSEGHGFIYALLFLLSLFYVTQILLEMLIRFFNVSIDRRITGTFA